MKFLQKWQGRNLSEQNGAAFSARVPGNIQYDYGVAHGFADVQYADNYKQYLALEQDAWEYSAHLQFEAAEGEGVWFVSEGIDYKCDILLNGRHILSHEGMYSRIEVELCGLLGNGRDLLSVQIHPHPKSLTGRAGTRDEADECCKAPVCYGWDWNPRLLISGMWQDAYIETRGAYYIGGAEALASVNADFSEGRVRFSYDCDAACTVALYDADGNEVCSGEGKELTLHAPRLWWCRGQGEAYLYTWVIRNAREERRGQLGFRRVRLVRNAGASDPKLFPKGRYAAPATVELNGRRILAKGSNWVNPELFWGNIDEARYDELLVLARDAEMNLLRVWGGAGVCKQSFYTLCDRYGILVWQEFMLACNKYPDSETYLAVLEQEAKAVIGALRAHPCLAIWCGGNELFNSWSGMDDQSLALRLLNKLCFELDPERPFLATSPLYGMGHGGYAFDSAAQEGEVFRRLVDCDNTAYTEFGIPSMSSVEGLERIIPADELFPIRRTAAWEAHHGFGAWMEDSWLHLATLEKYFGASESLAQMVERSSWLQAEGYKLSFEEMRRQWPRCSMMLNWCFDEPWGTAANNSIIEYPARPKPAYRAICEALRPTLFSARIPKFMWTGGETFEAEVWLLNDAPSPASGRVHIALELGGKRFALLDWEACAEALANLQGPTVRLRLPDLDCDRMTLVLQSDGGRESRYSLRYNRKRAALSTRLMNA